jgi:hypothetical protein
MGMPIGSLVALLEQPYCKTIASDAIGAKRNFGVEK